MPKKLDLYRKALGNKRKVTDIVCPSNREPSLAKIRREANEGIVKLYLHEAIIKMLNLAGVELAKDQVKYIVDYVLSTYWWYTLSDFNVITGLLIGKKLFGKGKIQDVIEILTDYECNHRTVASEKLQTEKASKLKQEQADNKAILEHYTKLKKEAKEKPKSQKEVDSDNIQANNKRIEKLKEIYPGI